MKGSRLRYPAVLDPRDEDCVFPDVSLALAEPNGLLAIGGRLSPACLLDAYRRGIFPWYEEGQPILWWSPDPRLVLFPPDLKVSRSLRRTLRRGDYEVTFDRAFEDVIRSCGELRERTGTWITEEMAEAYVALHELGYAHSAEAWHEGELAGGLYGVAIGGVFFGESMFHRRTDASKAAFSVLVRHLEAWGFRVIDCQMRTSHLVSLGAVEIGRDRFVGLLGACAEAGRASPWRVDRSLVEEEGWAPGPASA
jgi:leucyl/phenylalanyl-tRNA--protein transferase